MNTADIWSQQYIYVCIYKHGKSEKNGKVLAVKLSVSIDSVSRGECAAIQCMLVTG